MYVGDVNVTIGKRYTFEAAHRLPNHPGKCSRPHGHSYVLEVDFTGPVQVQGPQGGMVWDYYRISQMVKVAVVDRFDHQDLNEAMKFLFIRLEDDCEVLMNPEQENCTTAENMVVLFAGMLQEALYVITGDVRITRVRLCETATSWAEVKF